jgi:hypothetical protein
MTLFQIGFVAIIMGVFAAGLLWARAHHTAAATRRSGGMMSQLGLDPLLVSHDTLLTETAGALVLNQCRKCRSEDMCEDWLAGYLDGDPGFCPNALTFENLMAAAAYKDPDTEAA